MRLVNLQVVQAVFVAHRLHTRKTAPEIIAKAVVATDCKLHHMMPAQPGDEFSRSSAGNDLSLIDDGQSVAKAFGLVHVVSREQYGAAMLLKSPDDLPQLSPALGIETGSRLI